MTSLFEEDLGVDDSPKDDTDIIQVLLYYSKPEMKRFKELCKIGMEMEYGSRRTESNACDLILKLLEDRYGLV